MNNKDLFNAINDIDEKFITDAGKYLKDDPLSPYEPTEAHPAERLFSPLKTAASVAAAAILICGTLFAVKLFQPRLSAEPSSANETANSSETYAAELGGAAGSGQTNTSDHDSAPVTDHTSPEITEENSEKPQTDDNWKSGDEPVGPLPFTLIGPDYQQIHYEEITDIENGTSKKDLNDTNWNVITCDGFAYIAPATGMNFNSADNPEQINNIMNDNKFENDNAEFSRIYTGEHYNDLVVDSAKCEFWRIPANGMNERQMNEKGFPQELLYYGSSVHFRGTVTIEAYLVRETDDSGNDVYYIVPRSGAAQLPVIDIAHTDAEKYRFKANTSKRSIGMFEYSNEMPAITVIDDIDLGTDAFNVDRYFSEFKNYLKVVARLDDIDLSYRADRQFEGISASVEILDIQLSDNALEPLKVSEIIDDAQTLEDLYSISNEINDMYDGFGNKFRVYSNISSISDDIIGDEITYGELRSGMIIAMYDKYKKLSGLYTYRAE